MIPFFEAKEITFSFDGKKNVLDHFSLRLHKGSVTALLGRNGCGKSTFLDTAIGHHRPLSGELYLEGKSLFDMSSRELAKGIAYVPQAVLLNMDYSVLDFILFGRAPYITPWKQPSNEDRKIAKGHAERLGLLSLLEKSITKISGGERQLACIARAMTQGSPLMLLDEPTSALDFGNQAKLFQIINNLSSEGKTILFTTHNPNHLIDLRCDVALMENGNITTQGNAGDILSEETLSRLYGKEIFRSPDGYFRFSV